MPTALSIPSLPATSHPGILALAGSGEYLSPMQSVDKHLLERIPGTPRVVCLPTAAGNEGSERIKYWSRLGEQYFSELGVQVTAVPVIDQASAANPAYADQIRGANFVYLSGGKPEYLFRTLQDSAAWAAIWSVLEVGGVLAGCSAGAMILGERLPRFPLPGLGMTVFGLLPGTVIVPHYDEIPKAFVQATRGFIGNRVLVGIEANTALVSFNGRYIVAGSGRVTFWGPETKTQLSSAGEEF